MLEQLMQRPAGIFLVIMTVILLAPMLSQFVRLPGIVGLIFGGLLIGPYGLGLLERQGTIALLASIGLIYLMFSAGAEIDLNQFSRVRNRSITFGVLTFIIPQSTGIVLGRLLGYDLLSSILLGSIFASHTLVGFPIITRLGVTRDEAISVTVGATIITDVAALLVLAVVASVKNGDVTLFYFVQLTVLVIGYTLLILLGVPRLGRFFFRRFTVSSVEFQFVLVVLFVAAALAEVIGMEAIVGAFLAGLAINATLPPRSAVMGRVLFIGESFFIPIFLIGIGMLVDPRAFFTDSRTLLVSAALVITIFTTKFAASWISSRLFGYSRDQLMVMWGLSMAQAAATLAASLVGVEIGLFDAAVFNGAVMMILFTCVASPLIIERFAPTLSDPIVSAPVLHTEPIFSRVLVPLANPATEEYLISLAGILVRTADGILMPLNIARLVDGQVEGLDHQRNLLDAEILHDPETRIQPIRRVDTSVARGILSSAVEHHASTIIMGWSSSPTLRESIFGRMLDAVIWEARVPVLVARLNASINACGRVTLIILHNSISIAAVKEVVETGITIARSINAPLFILLDADYEEVVRHESVAQEYPFDIELLSPNLLREQPQRFSSRDLVLVTTAGTRQRFQSSLGSFPENIAEQTAASLVVIRYPHEY